MNDYSSPLAEEFERKLIVISVKTIKVIHSDKHIPLSVQNQLTRSVTSVGANYAEAMNASSKADFRNKLYIAKKEAAESIYWLKIIQELSDLPEYKEIQEELIVVLKTLQKSISTINKRFFK